MLRFRFFFFTALVSAGAAFSQTVIMGHHLGETVTQFLAEEPGLAGRIDNCRATEPKPMTAEQIHALSKQDAYALGEQVFSRAAESPDEKVHLKWIPKKGELEELAGKGMVITFDKRMPDVIATCHSLLGVTAPPTSDPIRVQSLPNTHPRPITWRFTNGLLSQIDIDFQNADFSDVAQDVSNKTNVKPNEDKEVDTPNLYGAILHVYRKATWLTAELYALLEKDQGTANGEMHLSVITRAEYDAWARKHLKKGELE